MLGLRLQLHQIDDIDHPDFQSGQILTQNGNGGQYLQRRRIAATSHHYIRIGVLVVAGPFPNAYTFRAMHDSGLHTQPLRESVFARHYDIHIMPTAQAMIKNRE